MTHEDRLQADRKQWQLACMICATCFVAVLGMTGMMAGCTAHMHYQEKLTFEQMTTKGYEQVVIKTNYDTYRVWQKVRPCPAMGGGTP